MTAEEEYERLEGMIEDLQEANACLLELCQSHQQTLKTIMRFNSLGKTKEIADLINKELN
jgi:prefoldin subunit 5